jgi:L-ascorbate metabolism protein UlaG (beta-lactamase superfamily)
LVFDDNLANLGAKSITRTGDVALVSSPDLKVEFAGDPKIKITTPGEYEISDVSVVGIAARGHMDEDGKRSAVMYKVTIGDISALMTGHVYPEFSEDQLEKIGEVDVMLVPVGGSGFTLDSVGALKLIRDVEPKLVVPTQYADNKLKFEMPAQTLDEAIKGLAMEPKERVAKLKLKTHELVDTTQLIVLEKQ